MFLDFTVENYRSIKEPVTLSAVAQKSSSRQAKTPGKRQRIKPDHEIAPGYHVEGWDLDILPVLALFGANASGKTNIIQALDYLLFLIFLDYQGTFLRNLIKQPNPDSFKLDSISSLQPTKFELRTIFDGSIYTYSLAISTSRVFSERLTYTPVKTKRSRLLFDRSQEGDAKEITWKIGSDFTGSHTQLQDIIRDDTPFINTLTKLKIKSIDSLTRWIKLRWFGGIELGNEEIESFHIKSLLYDNWFLNQILDKALIIVKKFDTGLLNIEVESISDTDDYRIYALHKTHDEREIKWLFNEESLGTQRLFALAIRIVLALEFGSLLVVDELRACL